MSNSQSHFIHMNVRSGIDSPEEAFSSIWVDGDLRSDMNSGEFPFPPGFAKQFGFSDSSAKTPLLSEESSIPSLNNSFPGLPRSVTFSPAASYENNPQIYCFHIRDTSGCLLAKGSVRRATGSVELQSTTGATFMFMVPTNNSDARNLEYDVRHQTKHLGKVLVSGSDSFRMTNSVEDTRYALHSISTGDISICRTTSGTPICNIHMDPSISPTSFSGSLVLPSQHAPTKVEQCLCIAVAITFMVGRNKVTQAEEVAAAERAPMESCLGCLGAIVVVLLICFALWAILKIAGSATCSSRYKEHPGVKSKGCTSDGYPDWI